MTISFEQIRPSIRKPGAYMEFNTRLAVRTLPANPQRVCLVVPMGDGATVDPLVPTQFFSDEEAQDLFGGTVARAMATAAIKTFRYLDISAVGIEVADGTEPDITPALDATAGGDFTILVPAWNSQTALTALRTHIETWSDAIEQQALIGVTALTSTLSAATTLAGQLNSGAITAALLPGTSSSAAEVAAAYAAVIASEEDPARPLNTLELSGIAVPALADRLRRVEQETLLANGITPLEVGPGERVQIVRAITTYTRNATGAEDIALLDLTTIRTLYYVRKACRDRIRLRFPREKLNDRIKDQVRSELLDVLKKCEELEITEKVDDNASGLVVERSLQNPNRLDAKIPVDVVNGLHIFAGRIDLLL